MKRLFNILILLSALYLRVSAHDTIRVMQYNLLYYDMITSFCTESNNNVNQKNIYLNTIVDHYKPDIFTVNELNGNPASVSLLLNEALNVNGANHYQSASFTGSYLVNMLYYNSNKLALQRQSHIQTSPRLTDIYTLYYLDEHLVNGDTTFLTCIVTHLKAGSTVANQNERAQSARQIMDYIESKKLKGNVMFMGDLNVYTHLEEAFQRFISPTQSGIELHDPANAVGHWHDNAEYAPYHTQSTHISGGCFSGGGMDDRFDFILASSPLIEGTRGAKYIDGSYWAYGQDGNRLNGSLTNPENNSLPADVIYALYNMSDHLPVTLKLHMDRDLYLSSSNPKIIVPSISIINPMDNALKFSIKGITPQQVQVQIHNTLGVLVHRGEVWAASNDYHSVELAGLRAGIYLITFSGTGFLETRLIVKQ